MSRLIIISRSSRREPYGFDFKTLIHDGKHIVTNVIPDSLAFNSGLKNGDFIIEVNGESVCGIWHDAVALKMSTFPRKIELLVTNDIETYIKSKKEMSVDLKKSAHSKKLITVTACL